MFPAAAVALEMRSIADLKDYFGVPQDLWQAFIQEAGNPNDDLRLLAALPGNLVLSQATLPGDTRLTAIQAAQVGLVWKLARRLMFVKGGGDWDRWEEEDPWSPTPTSPGRSSARREASSPGESIKESKERTLKFTQVLDQGDDGEFEVLNEEDKMVLLQRYVNTTGAMPAEEEEPTIEQLSALKKKLALGKPPYCDFGVFVPFGRKALRASKYRTWIPTAEGYVSKELPGPANFTQWRACYRVFTTAMLMLQECTLAPLHAYELYVEKLTRLYPDAWHLVYSADEMARSELLSRLRIKINLDQKEGRPIPSLFDEKKPWETVFKMIPGELKFWQDQIHGLKEDIANYVSVVEQEEDAREEIGRLSKLGYVIKVPKKEVEKAGFKGTTVSKLGLIVKKKEDGSTKRRIIIDLKRSGGNDKAYLPERLILPRPVDAIAMLRRMHATHSQVSDPQAKVMELVMIDISDAYMHLAMAEEEKGHCLAPALDNEHWLLFVALTAPLTWSRVAAMVARFVQAIIPADQGMRQVYLDDSFWVLCGKLATRNQTLALILTTMAALGLKVSLSKGERAAAVTWMGVKFKLVAPDYDHLLVTLPEKFMKELQDQLSSWEKKGMIGTNELRKAAGRVAWLAGILPRARWVTSSLYAALYDHEEDVAKGLEAERRARRKDNRPKDHLVAVKRVEEARRWLVAYLKAAQSRPIRKFSLYKSGKAEATLMTDASPMGLGALLLVNGRVTKALASPVVEQDSKLLGFALGESSSQGIVETLAILVALKHWGRLLASVSVSVAVQSDSITALAMTQKFSNSGSALNFLGAELAVACEGLGLSDIMPVHLPGIANKEADFLSRPDTWATTTLPAALEGITIETPEQRTVGWYTMHPPGPDSTEWPDSDALLAAWAYRSGFTVRDEKIGPKMEVVASTTLTATPLVPIRWHYPWQFYSLCYLIAIGLLTHLVVAWLGYKLCRQWIRNLLNPPRSSKGDSKGAEEMEDEAWQEPWDMDGEYETMAWTPTDGLRHRHLESPGPTPWANMLARLDREAHRETTNTTRITEMDTLSSMRSMTLRGSDRGTEFVTVTADTRFEFPSMDFYHEIATSGLGMGEEVGRKLEKIYRSLLQMLALPLTPHGSKGLIEKQIHEICAKFPRYKDGMKGLEMDERADLLVDAAEAADGNASDVSASMDFGFARIISGGYQSGQGSAGYLGHILEGSDSIVSVENEHAAWVSVKEDEREAGKCIAFRYIPCTLLHILFPQLNPTPRPPGVHPPYYLPHRISMSRNKMDAREGSPPHLDTFRQDLVTMNVRMERILEAQTSKVADAAAQARLKPAKPFATQELCIEPRSQSRLRSIAKKAFPRMLPPEEVCPPRTSKGIQTDAEAQPTHKHAKTHAILKEIGTGSIGLPRPRGSSLPAADRMSSFLDLRFEWHHVKQMRGLLRPLDCHEDTSRLSQQLQDAAVTLEEDLRREIAACHEELLLCASSINDLDGQLGEAHDIVGALKTSDKVDILRAEVLWIRDVSAKVRRQSEEDLRTGTRQGNHIALSVALQVFFNLQCLWPMLKKLLTELLEEVRQAPLPASSGFHQALEVNLQVLVAQTQRVHALDEIVQAKADPVTHKSFQSVLEASNVSSLTSHFWAEAAGVFKAKFAKVCQDRAFRAKAVSDCPKVLQSLVSAVEKLGRGKVMKAQERETLFQSAAELRNESRLRSEGFALELSQFRLLRMVRLVRVLRLLRVVRFCSELRIMVNGIAGSMKTLFWAMLLLGILIAMSWIIDYFMGIYVFFTVFCFINVVTGIFVDNAKELGEQETLHQRAGQYLRRQRWVKEVVNLFAKMDVSSEGDLSYEEFMAEIKDERVQDCFPIRQFHGTARSIDVYKIRRDTQKIGKQLHYLACALGCDAHRELLE
eukprot:g10919.t1